MVVEGFAVVVVGCGRRGREDDEARWWDWAENGRTNLGGVEGREQVR